MFNMSRPPAMHAAFLKKMRPSFIIELISHFVVTSPARIFSDKICCDLLEARLVASKFFTVVLGGTAALHIHRVWGAVIFWGQKMRITNGKR
jgi:hypothetical protein